MKNLQKIAFLILTSLALTNLQAGKDDLHKLGHQQKQIEQQKAKYFQQSIAGRSTRYESRHPYKPKHPVKISSQQKKLALFFAALALGTTLVNSDSVPPSRESYQAAISTLQPNSDTQPIEIKKTETALIRFQNPANQTTNPLVHLKPYTFGDENKTNGPCEQLLDGSKLCHDIQSNYTVESCIHPIRKGLSHCVFFDPVGIIDDQTNPEDDLIIAESKIREICSSQEQRFDLKNEFNDFMEKEAVSNLILETHMEFTDPNNLKSFGMDLPISIINDPKTFPKLYKMILKFTYKFNLQKTPLIGIYNPPISFPIASVAIITIDGHEKSSRLLMLTRFALQNFSDERLENILGHEFQHLKQEETDRTKNNIEVEADIASVLATSNPCLYDLIRIDLSKTSAHLTMPLTRENLDKTLLTSAPSKHQPYETGILSTYGTHKNLQKARQILIESIN